MAVDLKKSVINMKHLSQDIDDPIVVNAADANGRTLEIIFTQEAAAQLTPDTKVYLSWYHQQQKIKGYNVFTYIPGDNPKRDPYRWQIFYPQSMLYCGDVLACIELVDDVSIAASNNFMIHVLEDPNDGSTFVVSDDFSEFKNAVIALNNTADRITAEFEDMKAQHQYVLQTVESFEDNIEDLRQQLAEIQTQVDESLRVRMDAAEENIEDLDNRVTALEENDANWTETINQAKQDAIATSVEQSNVVIEKIYGGPPDSFIFRYIFRQGGTQIENGRIDITKDMVATSGSLIYPTPQRPIEINGTTITSGTYIRMTIANGQPFYINVADLIEYNTFQNTDEIIITDIDHSVTANIGEILANKIIYQEEILPQNLGSIEFYKNEPDDIQAWSDNASDVLAALAENNVSGNDIVKVNVDGNVYEYSVHPDLTQLPQQAYLYPTDENSDFSEIYLTQDGLSDIGCPAEWEGGTVSFTIGESQPKQTVAEAIDELQDAVSELTWKWLTPSS